MNFSAKLEKKIKVSPKFVIFNNFGDTLHTIFICFRPFFCYFPFITYGYGLVDAYAGILNILGLPTVRVYALSGQLLCEQAIHPTASTDYLLPISNASGISVIQVNSHEQGVTGSALIRR